VTPHPNVTLIGVGLIGGSIGQALRARRLAGRVVGVGRDPGRLEEARRLGAIDEGATDLARAVAAADVVVVCTPVDRIAAEARRAAALAPGHALVTDAGSTKARIVAEVEADPRARAAFVGAHPIAGSERNGVAHARPDLFDGRPCALTPTDRTPPDRLGRARAFWSSIGCTLVELDPESHDRALAATSHLPHVVAAALASAAGADRLDLAAGAYRDTTRVAAADPALWTAIFLENRAPLLDALDRLDAQLDAFRRALRDADAPALLDWWRSARENRLRFERPKSP
jgi:prephenate dehydrogenase